MTEDKHTKLSEIRWPVFKLGERQPQQESGLVYYYTHYVDELNCESATIRVVDDTSVPGATLGLRRLQLKTGPKVTLFPIRTAIYFLADLVKLAKSTSWFVDNSGRVFHYEKSVRAKLTTKRIKQVLPASGLGCVFELQGVPSRFKAMRRPQEHELYARVLQLGMGFIFYGFCDAHKPDSWRMV